MAEKMTLGQVLGDMNKLTASGQDAENWQVVDWCAAIRAHLAQPASPAGVPDGMVLVPWEPTPVMLAIYEHIRSGSDWQAHVFRLTKRQLNKHRAAYKAMIAAAPSAPTENAGMPNQVRLTIERCLRYQERVAEQIEKSNPGDPYAASMVREDIEYLRAWLTAAPSAPEE